MKNQKIISKLVDREVIACASSLIHRLERVEEFQEEMCELSLASPDYKESAIQEGWEEFDESNEPLMDKWRSFCARMGEDEDPTFLKVENNIISDYSVESDWSDLCDEQRVEAYPPEVFEHWIVTEWAAEKLQELGECVGEFENLHIWGRTTTGQAISLDCAWERIASDLEILEGQKNSWADDN